MPLFAFIFAIALALITHPLPAPSATIIPAASPPVAPSPQPTSVPKLVAIPKDNSPWGVAQKIGEHTYQIKVQNDAQMGTPDEILSALNDLRRRNGAQALQKDSRLCDYTVQRAKYQDSLGKTDAHAGFEDFLTNLNGFEKLGYGRVGENSSYGYVMSGVHLIEFVYMQSPEHNANQLNPDWDRGCVGTAGSATNLLFATSPL